jgi:inner membrane protein
VMSEGWVGVMVAGKVVMDSITHIVLGAAIGELVAGRKLGKKALLIGAVANSLPDIDFVSAFWLDTSRDVVFHRGITHSLLFVVVMACLLALVAMRLDRSRGSIDHSGGTREGTTMGSGMKTREGMTMGSGMTMRDWVLLFGLELFTHIFIDAFNAYGTGWFEPFDHYRVCFNVLFVADPLYSVWLGLAAVMLVVLRRTSMVRRRWAWFGLVMSSGYLCYSVANKVRVDRAVERQLGAAGIRYERYFTTPTPFNDLLWYVVVGDSAGYFTGYRSVFDEPARSIDFRWQPRNEALLRSFAGRSDVGYLLRFAQGYYTVGNYRDSLVFNVLRFGEIQGWRNPAAPFVFHYFLDDPADNKFVVQRGRWQDWDRAAVRAFVRRMEGE